MLGKVPGRGLEADVSQGGDGGTAGQSLQVCACCMERERRAPKAVPGLGGLPSKLHL